MLARKPYSYYGPIDSYFEKYPDSLDSAGTSNLKPQDTQPQSDVEDFDN